MTSTYRQKSRLSTLVEIGTATLAAGSAGFVAFAMPDSLFSRLVEMSRLPQFLAAAQPPLGNTARLAVVALAALLTFAFVWSLLRALDRRPGEAAAPDALDEVEDEAPRVRKADAHPDAPARRPILAGRELGEPIEAETDEYLAEELAPEEAEAPAAEPLPSFLVAQAPEPEPEPEPVAEAEPVEPWPWRSEEEANPQPEAEHEPEAEAEQEDESEPSDAADLSHLMQRFETGLTRKQQAIVRPVPQAEPAPAPIATAPIAPLPAAPPVEEAPNDRVGHRLRSAIAELQKTAGGRA